MERVAPEVVEWPTGASSRVVLFHQNHARVLIRDGSQRCRVQRRDAADRREVNPPIEVELAMWSAGGQLDWWVKERQ